MQSDCGSWVWGQDAGLRGLGVIRLKMRKDPGVMDMEAKFCWVRGESQSALTLKPGFTDAYNNMASALVQKGCIPQAMDCYAAALRIDPNVVSPLHESHVASHGTDDSEGIPTVEGFFLF